MHREMKHPLLELSQEREPQSGTSLRTSFARVIARLTVLIKISPQENVLPESTSDYAEYTARLPVSRSR